MLINFYVNLISLIARGLACRSSEVQGAVLLAMGVLMFGSEIGRHDRIIVCCLWCSFCNNCQTYITSMLQLVRNVSPPAIAVKSLICKSLNKKVGQ